MSQTKRWLSDASPTHRTNCLPSCLRSHLPQRKAGTFCQGHSLAWGRTTSASTSIVIYLWFRGQAVLLSGSKFLQCNFRKNHYIAFSRFHSYFPFQIKTLLSELGMEVVVEKSDVASGTCLLLCRRLGSCDVSETKILETSNGDLSWVDDLKVYCSPNRKPFLLRITTLVRELQSSARVMFNCTLFCIFIDSVSRPIAKRLRLSSQFQILQKVL